MTATPQKWHRYQSNDLGNSRLSLGLERTFKWSSRAIGFWRKSRVLLNKLMARARRCLWLGWRDTAFLSRGTVRTLLRFLEIIFVVFRLLIRSTRSDSISKKMLWLRSGFTLQTNSVKGIVEGLALYSSRLRSQLLASKMSLQEYTISWLHYSCVYRGNVFDVDSAREPHQELRII